MHEALMRAVARVRLQRFAVAAPQFDHGPRARAGGLRQTHSREHRLVPAYTEVVQPAVVSRDALLHLVGQADGGVEIGPIIDKAGTTTAHVNVVRRRPATGRHYGSLSAEIPTILGNRGLVGSGRRKMRTRRQKSGRIRYGAPGDEGVDDDSICEAREGRKPFNRPSRLKK